MKSHTLEMFEDLMNEELEVPQDTENAISVFFAHPRGMKEQAREALRKHAQQTLAHCLFEEGIEGVPVLLTGYEVQEKLFKGRKNDDENWKNYARRVAKDFDYLVCATPVIGRNTAMILHLILNKYENKQGLIYTGSGFTPIKSMEVLNKDDWKNFALVTG